MNRRRQLLEDLAVKAMERADQADDLNDRFKATEKFLLGLQLGVSATVEREGLTLGFGKVGNKWILFLQGEKEKASLLSSSLQRRISASFLLEDLLEALVVEAERQATLMTQAVASVDGFLKSLSGTQA